MKSIIFYSTDMIVCKRRDNRKGVLIKTSAASKTLPFSPREVVFTRAGYRVQHGDKEGREVSRGQFPKHLFLFQLPTCVALSMEDNEEVFFRLGCSMESIGGRRGLRAAATLPGC